MSKLVTGSIVLNPYMGMVLSYIVQDRFGVATEYVNIRNLDEALKLGSKHVRATITDGRATVLGLDPEADLEPVQRGAK